MNIDMNVVWALVAILGILFTGMSFILASVLLTGWLMYKVKTINMPTPFIQAPKLKKEKPVSYVDNLYSDEPEEPDDQLSSAASRLRAQKHDDTKRTVMQVITGKGR